MGVKSAEKELLDAAQVYVDTKDSSNLLRAAIGYGRAKIESWRSRDNWKSKKRLGQAHGKKI